MIKKPYCDLREYKASFGKGDIMKKMQSVQ